MNLLVTRILVLGPAGAGKSTLAHGLGARLGLRVVHLDGLALEHGGPETGPFRDALQQTLDGDAWIIDGTYETSLEQRLARAHAVILVDPGIRTSVRRVLSRRARLKAGQDTLGPPQRNVALWRQLVWIIKYRLVVGPRIRERVQTLRRDVTLLELAAAAPSDDWLADVLATSSHRDRGTNGARAARPTGASN